MCTLLQLCLIKRGVRLEFSPTTIGRPVVKHAFLTLSHQHFSERLHLSQNRLVSLFKMQVPGPGPGSPKENS